MAKSPEEMAESMIQNLREKTGKTLDQWLALLHSMQKAKYGEVVRHLKEKHALTHGYANLITHKLLKTDAGSASAEVDLVVRQYSGDKIALRPIYDKLISHIQKFGNDVELAPKNSYVSLRRAKQFAIIQPSTKTRIDVGINLKGAEATTRLEASGSFNTMVSHRVKISSSSEVDAELIGWLKQAYDAS